MGQFILGGWALFFKIHVQSSFWLVLFSCRPIWNSLSHSVRFCEYPPTFRFLFSSEPSQRLRFNSWFCRLFINSFTYLRCPKNISSAPGKLLIELRLDGHPPQQKKKRHVYNVYGDRVLAATALITSVRVWILSYAVIPMTLAPESGAINWLHFLVPDSGAK